MKKMNNKGFTLIELLAVVVILAILVAVSVPAVTKYLGTARKGTFADNAQQAISAVRNDVIINGYDVPGSSKEYKIGLTCTEGNGCTVDNTVGTINSLLEKKLIKSPYGKNYTADSYIKVTIASDGNATYSICLSDGAMGVKGNEVDIDESSVQGLTTCTE